MKQLSKETQALLNELVLDLTEKSVSEISVFKFKDAPSYIYNLLTSTKYKYSYNQYKELFDYLTNQ
jgi:hypothetical protein